MLLMIVSLGACEEENVVSSEPRPNDPMLLSMKFNYEKNKKHINNDVYCKIIGDSIVECWLSDIQSDKLLIPSFEYVGDKVMIDTLEVTSNTTVCDFRKPVMLKVISGYKSRRYKVLIHAYTGIPILWIDTEKHKLIESKEKYLKAHFKLVEDVVTRSPGDIVELDGFIKGRGSSTWANGIRKLPYRIKFNEKVSFLGEHGDKSWVLLANYLDNTMLRNQIASYMGSIGILDYTPRFHYVDMILNGYYNGTYQLGEKIKVSKHRVNVGDDGFLLEFDVRATSDDIYFNVKRQQAPIVIKEPKVEVDDDNYKFIRDYVLAAEKTLFSDQFADPEVGWKKYMDMDSFVEWYLINEIAKNKDACLFSSCFMNLKRGGKLKMGPIWDFDLAFGNFLSENCVEYTDYWIKNTSWYSRLFEDPAFVARVKERFNFFYDHRDDIMNEIDANVRYIRYSVEENEHEFSIMDVENVWDSYQAEVWKLKNWINNRLEWLKLQFDTM